jgi:hypothetical protein
MATAQKAKKVLQESADEFVSVAADLFRIVNSARDYRRIIPKEYPEEMSFFHRHAHYEFRDSVRHGVTVEFHIESEKYRPIVELLRIYSIKKVSINGGEIEFAPKWGKHPGRIRVFPHNQSPQCVAMTMLELIDDTRKEIEAAAARNELGSMNGNEYFGADGYQPSFNLSNIAETERCQVIKARIGQNLFRDLLLSRWRKCTLTGCEYWPVLRASHIKPWSEADSKERLDVYNGLLLSPNMDALFDKGLITFKDSGEILISPVLSSATQKALGLRTDMRIELEKGHVQYISWHRKKHKFEKCG